MEMTLLQRLENIQQALGLSDREFARKLGISNTLWSSLKRHEQQIGRRTLLRIRKVFPELSDEVQLYWLRSLYGNERVNVA